MKRQRLAAVLIAIVARVVGGHQFAYAHNAAMVAGHHALDEQVQRRTMGLPLDDWAQALKDGAP